MRVIVESGVQGALSPEGEMMLLSPRSREQHVYTPLAAAMWIVLREYDGDLGAAAERLAYEWSSDVTAIRAAMETRVADWRNAGLVTTQHPDRSPS